MLNKHGKAPMLLIIILLVVVVGALGIISFKKQASSNHGKPAVVEVKDELVPLEEFVVNLADKREPRYLKVEISLKLQGDKAKEESEQLKPQVRDAVIQALSSKYYSDLLDPIGKEKLKKEIQKSLGEVFEECKVTGVFFTSFAMQ